MLSLEALAKAEIRAKLEAYQALSSEEARRLVVNSFHDGSNIVFELYVPGKQPRDALLIAKAVVDKHSREIAVEIYNLRKKAAALKQSTIIARLQNYTLSKKFISIINHSKVVENLNTNRFEKNFHKIYTTRDDNEINNLVTISASDEVSHQKTSSAMLNNMIAASISEVR